MGTLSKVVAIAATDTLVLQPNSRRIKVTFVNGSDAAVITISKGKTAVANEGIILQPHGSYEDIPIIFNNGKFYIYTGEIRAISTVAAAPLGLIEEYL